MLALIIALLPGVLGYGQDPSVPCYMTISNGAEYCFYRPTVGYQCDIGVAQDPAKRANISECNNLGQCYVVVSNGDEVCYYTPPYGYDCYYEYLPALVANMTNCEYLKANSPPDITFGTVNPVVTEDTPLLVSDIVINDVDARDSENEGRGFLLVDIVASNGLVRFSPDDLNSVNTQKATNARNVLSKAKELGGIDFSAGNGTWAQQLTFQIRCDPLLTVLPAFEVIGAPDYNGVVNVLFTVNDQGNTGGTAEIRSATLPVTITPVNDPPVIGWSPLPPSTLEDTPLTITGLKVYDVDSLSVELLVTVTKATLRLACESSTCAGVTVVHLSNNRVLKVTGNVANRASTSSPLQTAISQLIYVPDRDVNDDTGVEQMNVTANDKTSYLPVSTSIVPVHVTPVNDPPVLFAPPYFSTDEDTTIRGINLTVADVDTFWNQTVTLTVQHGLLSVAAPYNLGPSTSVVLQGALTDLVGMFSLTNYTPTANFNGQDTLSVDMNDGGVGGHPAVMNIPITVWPVNDNPVFTVPAMSLSASSIGATVQIISGLDPVSVADVDFVGNPTFSMQLLVSATFGQVRLASVTGLTVTIPATGFSTSTYYDLILVMGSQTDINAALGNLYYQRTANGAEALFVAANDLRYYGSGPALTDVAFVSVS